MKIIRNEPNASRLATSMRDTGYNFNTAAADIIDNSIAANANLVNVSIDLIEINGEYEKFVFFGDNGHGMNRQGIIDGMRYGAPERKDAKSLGKFGLGLKTASTAVCKKLSVISRNEKEGPINKFSWDIDHIDKIDEWEMLEEDVLDFESEKFNELCGEIGTLIVWSKCDRVLSNTQYEPGSPKERAALKRLSNKLKVHVEKHFHKFLDSNEIAQDVSITIDGEEAVPWNPFFPEDSRQVLSENKQKLRILLPETDKYQEASIKAWILPHSKDVDAKYGKNHARNVFKINNPNQGFYVYREGRMIHAGDWLDIWNTRDPHYSLIRVELDFTHELDEAFAIDVQKARIIFDEVLADYLKNLLEGPREEANRIYRRSQAKQNTKGINHTGSNTTIKGNPNKEQPKVDDVDPLTNSVTITGPLGTHTLNIPVFKNVSVDQIWVTPVDDITTGDLWEVGFNSDSDADFQLAVRINKHHEFYNKVYAKSNGDVVDGIDFLLWSLASAEAGHSTKEMKAFWEDVRAVVSRNIRTLLSDYDIPT